MKKTLLMLALAGTIPLAHAADDLGTVVVSAARVEQPAQETPASITVISRDQIQAQGADNLAEVLDKVAGIVVDDLFGDGSRTKISMRGFGENSATNTLVLLDGRRLNDITLASPQLINIPLESIERIEIVKGSAGTLYGDRAVGGVINIITRKPGKLSASIEAAGGSYGRKRVRANLSQAQKSGLEYRLATELRKSDGYREHNELDHRNLFGTIGYRHDSGRVFLDGQIVSEYLHTPGALSLAEAADDPRQSLSGYANDFTDRLDRFARAGVEQDLGEAFSLLAEWSYRKEDKTFRTGGRFAPDLYDNSSLLTQSEFTPRLVYEQPSVYGVVRMVLGYDWLKGRYDADYVTGFGLYPVRATQNKDAFYLQARVPLAKTLSLTAGGRKARADNSSASVDYERQEVSVWTLGAEWVVSESLHLSLRRDGNFRFATVDELGYTLPGQPLLPQKGVSWELGADWKHGRVDTSVSVYRLALDNEIAYAPQAPSLPFYNINLDPTRRDGLILNVGHDFARDRIDVSYSLVRAHFRSGAFAGNTVGGVPEQTARISWNRDWGHGWETLLEGLYNGRQYLQGDYDNTQGELGGYAVFNARVAWSVRKLTFALRVNNLGDKRYLQSAGYSSLSSLAYGYPAPGRNFWLSAQYDF